jgi:CTP synthase (UTP-ammonia lyase)
VAIALVGERNPGNMTHEPTERAFAQLSVETTWVDTALIADDPAVLSEYDGVMLPPAMPYANEDGALAAIRFAREQDVPLLGTCGGFQYVIVELARSILGISDAVHAETSPDAENHAVVPLACSLVGQEHPVRIEPNSLAGGLYRVEQSIEPFYCSYGVNPALRAPLETAGVRFSGFDLDGEPRILELRERQFFLATLYVPQAKTAPAPHPLIAGFVAATRHLSKTT